MVFANLSFWADISAFLGLAAAIVGLVMTVLTWCRAGSIQNVLKRSHDKHLLAARTADYITRLQDISERITGMMRYNSEVRLRPAFTKALAESRAIGTSIKNKTKENNADSFKSLNVLVDFIDDCLDRLPSLSVGEIHGDLQKFLLYIDQLQHEIDQNEKDRKESL